MKRLALIIVLCFVAVACRPVQSSDWNYENEQEYRQVSSLLLWFDSHTFVFNSTLSQDLVNMSSSPNFDAILDVYLDDGGAALISEFDAAALPTSGGGGLGGDGFQSDYGAYLEGVFRQQITFWTQQRPGSFTPGDCFVLTFEVIGFSPTDLEDAYASGGFGSNDPSCAPGDSLIPAA